MNIYDVIDALIKGYNIGYSGHDDKRNKVRMWRVASEFFIDVETADLYRYTPVHANRSKRNMDSGEPIYTFDHELQHDIVISAYTNALKTIGVDIDNLKFVIDAQPKSDNNARPTKNGSLGTRLFD